MAPAMADDLALYSKRNRLIGTMIGRPTIRPGLERLGISLFDGESRRWDAV